MRYQGILAIFAVSTCIVGQVLAAEIIETIDIENMIEQSICESDAAMIRQHPMAQECLLLDLEAVVYDIFLTLRNQGQIDGQTYKLIKQNFQKLYPKEMERLKEERFHDFIGLAWHPLANVGIESFRAIVFSNLISMQDLARIAADLANSGQDEVAAYARDILKNLATKATCEKIIALWISTARQRTCNSGGEKGCTIQ